MMVGDSSIISRDRTVIPGLLRQMILKQFHSGHPVVNKTKSLARRYAYWPPANRDIEDNCHKCPSALQAVKNPSKCEPQQLTKPYLFTWKHEYW